MSKLRCYIQIKRIPRSSYTEAVFFTQLLDEFLDVAVVDYISFGGLQETLLLPDIVWNMVTAHSKFQRIFRYPEIRENHIFIILIQWREHQYKSRDVCGGRKVQATITYTAS